MSENNSPQIVSTSWLGRLAYIYITIVVPIASFFFSSLILPNWQSGESDAYVAVILQRSANKAFYPFLLWTMVSTLLLLWSSEKFGAYRVVRWGIYSGFVVATQYAILLLILTRFISLIIGVVSYLILLGLSYIYYRFNPQKRQIIFAIVILLLISTVTLARIQNRTADTLLFISLFISLLAGPVWCTLLTYTLSNRLYRHYDRGKFFEFNRYLASIGLWLFGYSLAWYTTVQRALEIYASRPTMPQYCVAMIIILTGLGAWLTSRTTV